MMTQQKKIKVSGVGCCLVDHLYNNVSFNSNKFSRYLSKQCGDGGLTPGQLVFREEFENFITRDFSFVIKEVTGNQKIVLNIGGPCIVSLINVAQLLGDTGYVKFHGCCGQDSDGEYLLNALRKTPIEFDINILPYANTPSTIVLSDPCYNNAQGERIFINTIGSAFNYFPADLATDFFDSDVVVFGGTALVPGIHDNLTELLERAKSENCITIVNTVYDFRNEKANPYERWPLGRSDDSYRNIDLLIMDIEESHRLSGKVSGDEDLQFFRDHGTHAVIITNGSENIRVFSDGVLFESIDNIEMPVSKAISEELKGLHTGDTTGCGDNFVGGVLASLLSQLSYKKTNLDLREACSLGVVSGGFACFYMGGTYIESMAGEKLEKIRPYYEKYKIQVGI